MRTLRMGSEGFRSFTVVAAFILALPACGSGSSRGICAQRSGTYRSKDTERSGTCGDIPEQIVTIDSEPLVPPAPCTGGEIRYSDDNCDVTLVNVVCPEPGIGPGVTSTTNGKVTWSSDGSSGSGVLTIVVRDGTGGILCQSSYNDVESRL
jgi:hypothetical protein